MARRRGFAPRSSGKRRLTEWSNLADQCSVQVSSGGATLISSLSFEDPGTIVRSRGIISVRPSAYTADVEICGAFGVGLVSSEALAIGVTAISEPFTDADWGGWMVWRPFNFRIEFISAVGVLFGDATVEIEIDSKAQRKVEPNSAMVFVAESQVGAFNIAEQVRLLQLLH